MWLNETEIDDLVAFVEGRVPEAAPYARYLSDWRDTVNANSDGWAYWKAGARCADRLSDLLRETREAVRERREPPSMTAFAKALAPIRSAATRHGLPAPVLAGPPAPAM